MEKLSKKTLSLPVLSIDEGEHLGYVKSLVIDPNKKEIAAFVITQKGWFKEDKIIPFNRVRNIGDNAIVIDKAGTAEKPANFPQIIKYVKNPAHLINSKVVTTSGKSLGIVDEFWFDNTGNITKFEISGKFSEGLWKDKAVLLCEDVVTIGKDAIMVADGTENRLITGNKPLQKTMSDLKTATTKAWDSTVQTSQKLGHAIVNSISKLAEEEKKAAEMEKTQENKEENPNEETLESPKSDDQQPENPVNCEEMKENNESPQSELPPEAEDAPLPEEPADPLLEEEKKDAKDTTKDIKE